MIRISYITKQSKHKQFHIVSSGDGSIHIFIFAILLRTKLRYIIASSMSFMDWKSSSMISI